MGYKIEVMEWSCPDGEYIYIQRYGGRNMLKAFWVMYQLKRRGAGCVKLYWR